MWIGAPASCCYPPAKRPLRGPRLLVFTRTLLASSFGGALALAQAGLPQSAVLPATLSGARVQPLATKLTCSQVVLSTARFLNALTFRLNSETWHSLLSSLSRYCFPLHHTYARFLPIWNFFFLSVA